MKQVLATQILEQLESRADELAARFEASRAEVGTRYCFLDGLLPEATALQVSRSFPPATDMRLMSTIRERKHTSKNFDAHAQILSDVTFAVQDPEVVAAVGRITGIRDQQPDPSLYAGGLSLMRRGHFLAPHIDNSHDGERRVYRTLNLLYYCTPDWSLADGGHLTLWNRDLSQRVVVESRFNRLVLMETHPTSWHSVSKVVADRDRLCVSNYYFSPTSPTGKPYSHVTSFSAPPDEPWNRFVLRLDAMARNIVRTVAPKGLGKKDVYQGRH